MNDQELLEYIDTKVFYQMMQGCEIDDHLGCTRYDTGSWSVCLRADMMSRLIDLAKKGLTND